VRIWKRTKFYWYEFVFEGRRVRASSKQCDKETAQSIASEHRSRLAKQGWGIERPKPIAVRELLNKLEVDYKQNGKWSAQNCSLLARVRAEFGAKMSNELTDEDVTKYKNKKLSEKYAKATINRSLETLRRACKLSKLTPPVITRLNEKDNVRQGFFTRTEFDGLKSFLPEDLRDFVFFAFLTGMRKSEIAALQWNDVSENVIRLRGVDAKTGKPRSIVCAGELASLLERRRAARALKTPGGVQMARTIFHRDGLPVNEFRKSWATACEQAKIPGRLFHDLRRTALRNLVRAGVSQTVAMKISGHTTISTFIRYDITSERDIEEAMQKLEAAGKAEQPSNVVQMSK
jgi:integrase